MDKLINGFGDLLINLGLPGLCLVVLCLTVRKLFTLYQEAMEKRATNAELTIPALDRNAVAFTCLAELIEQKKI